MKHLELKKNKANWTGSRSWVVLGKITGECYYACDRVNCCAWMGSIDGHDADSHEKKLQESGYHCPENEDI